MGPVQVSLQEGEGLHSIIDEMRGLSAALAQCLREHNDVIFDLQDRTLAFVQQAWTFVEQLTQHPTLVRRESEALLAMLREEQRRMHHTVLSEQEQTPLHRVYEPGPSQGGALLAEQGFAPSTSEVMPGYTRVQALRRLYEETVKNMGQTMGHAVTTQSHVVDLRTQVLESAHEALTTVLHVLAFVPPAVTHAPTPRQEP
jgi:hypothetical protein